MVSGQWQKRYNHGIYKLYKEIDLTRNTGLRRLQWVGHMMRIKDERVPKKAQKGYIDGRRPLGMP